MKLYKKLLIMTLLTLSIINVSGEISYGKDKSDMFKEILSNVDVVIEEYMVQGSFYSEEKPEVIYDKIISNVEKVAGQVNLEYENENNFKLRLDNKNYKGKIQILAYKQGYEVILNISICGENLDINEEEKLNGKISEILAPINSMTEYSLCIKSKILSNTIEEVKDVVLNELESYKAQNIDKVKINNGYSIISDTDIYNEKIILGKSIDFNCAIVRYSSGCYLIMGNPEIMVTY
ncbi:MAG: hypothetical protein RR636_09635 [Clostridium sp.]|uniref:hypothetical protein n=1 Tax=Clostridium sp. TaxID=1506 RepID=UPI00306CECD7